MSSFHDTKEKYAKGIKATSIKNTYIKKIGESEEYLLKELVESTDKLMY